MQANFNAIMGNRPVEKANRSSVPEGTGSCLKRFSKTLDRAIGDLNKEARVVPDEVTCSQQTINSEQPVTGIGQSLQSTGVNGKKAADFIAVNECSVRADIGSVDLSETDNLLRQLMEILRALGMTGEKETRAAEVLPESPESDGTTGRSQGRQAVSMHSLEGILSALGESGISGVQLKNALQQLIRHLNNSGTTGMEANTALDDLKTLIRAQSDVPVEQDGKGQGQPEAKAPGVPEGKPGAVRSGDYQSKQAGDPITFKTPAYNTGITDTKSGPAPKGQEVAAPVETGNRQSPETVHAVKVPFIQEQTVARMPMTEPAPTEQLPRMTQVIFGQIVQKAKLVITPGLSEVKIQLKPDFLGQLDLNVRSENGLVTARFNAENYRVKEVIEANLNILKDALAEQGIKVDQLQVHVGTGRDHSGLREDRQPFYNHGSAKVARPVLAEEAIESVFLDRSGSGVISEYYGSTVDFTA